MNENTDLSNRPESKDEKDGYFFFKGGYEDEREHEKTKIKKTATVIGVPLLVMIGVSHFWRDIYLFSASLLGVKKETALSFARELGNLQVFQIVLSLILFTAPCIISLKASKKRVSDIVPLKKPQKSDIVPYFLLGFSFCIFSGLIVSKAGAFFESFGINYDVNFSDHPSGFFGFMLTVLSTAIFPALLEEFAVRGIFMGLLLPFGEVFAVMSSAVLFGLMHGNFDQMPFAFLVGLVLGLIRIKTGTLYICCLVHFANNMSSVFFDYLSDGMSERSQNAVFLIYYIIVLLIGILGVMLLEKRNKTPFSLKKAQTKLKEKEKYKVFFLSFPVLAAVILYLLESLKYF